MKALRKADRRVLGWALAVWAVVTVLGAFWALPHIEDELDTRALRVDSYTATEGAEVVWNGRDGYLKVPEGTANAEQIASDLADTWGVRDVEIEVVPGNGTPATAPDEPADTMIPAKFDVTWDDSGAVGTGNVPQGTEGELNALFGTGDGLADDATRTLSDSTRAILTDRLAPLIGTRLPSGRLTVDGDDITITGVASDQAAADEILAELDGINGLTSTVSGPDSTPARFNVVWDGDGSTQDGDAPNGLANGVGSLGVASPLTAAGLTVGPTVEPAISSLAPLIGSDLIQGTLTVDDDQVTITGIAPDDGALARAQAALEGTGATLDLSASAAGSAQAEIDALLALDKIEFITSTATPTAATEGIIDSVADVLNRFKTIEVAITGHTDSRGNDAMNQALSESRAAAVRQGLIDRGIDESRLSTSGQGETEPIDSNDTKEGRQHNRRVEITAKGSNK